MIDPGTGLTILGSAIGGAKLVERVLGPTADYLGGGLKEWTQKRFVQVKKIFEHADQLIGDAPPAGRVPPRVLRDVMHDGSYRDDPLSAAYYGGILASSRTGVGRDDRGPAFSSLVGRLTSYQLRAHFVFYSTFVRLFTGEDINLLDGNERAKTVFYIPFDDYFPAMALEETEDHNAILSHVVYGLEREALIDSRFGYGESENLRKRYPNIPEDCNGIRVPPAALGVELFLWTNGHATSDINEILTADIQISNLEVSACNNAVRAIVSVADAS